jgi:hypothetical protein
VKYGLRDQFIRWYQDNMNTADADPLYPGTKFNATTYFGMFLQELGEGFELIVLDETIDVGVELL